MNGLTTVNIELTSRCNKSCWMCGRRKTEREHPELCNYGDMPLRLVQEIAAQIPRGIVVQFHWNGEPLLYDNLANALKLFPEHIRGFDTNGKSLLTKANELIGNLEVLTISVIQGDESFEKYIQWENVTGFLKLKGDKKPRLVYRCLGNVNDMSSWAKLPGTIVTRTLHAPMGSFAYEKPVTKPEMDICLEMLNHLAIDRFGNVSPCVRYDPEGKNILGHVNQGLKGLWYGDKRQQWVQHHIDGRRDLVPLCAECDYYGIPIG